MQALGPEHIKFLRRVAGKPNSIHPLNDEVPVRDADTMANEGLLIKYNKPNGPHYAIGRYGAQYVKDLAPVKPDESPEMRKLALEYIKSKGYEEPGVAEKILEEQGVERILATQADEQRNARQREVKIPTNAEGRAVLEPKRDATGTMADLGPKGQ